MGDNMAIPKFHDIERVEEIKIRDINSLKFADYNPRQLTTDQYNQLKKSINTFGLVDPIIVNTNSERQNIIIGGHQRVKVAKEMGVKQIPVVELNLSLERERELNVRLNKNNGEWNFDMLANNFEIDELLDWGFENYELGVNDKEDVDMDEIWEGMPEYENEDLEPYRTLKLHFRNEADVKKFSEMMQQQITDRTKSMWYPQLERETFKVIEYVDAE